MELLIRMALQANKFVPRKGQRTAAIRIYGTNFHSFSHYATSLHPNIQPQFQYEFDDLYSGDETDSLILKKVPNAKILDEETAKRIITDFISIKDKIDCLLVHCNEGVGRAPATGRALNDLFYLGASEDDLQYNPILFNQHVYDLLMKTGREIIIS